MYDSMLPEQIPGCAFGVGRVRWFSHYCTCPYGLVPSSTSSLEIPHAKQRRQAESIEFRST
jgi:hypothetical protein